MDSKWGGKTESINMKLNVEQVMHTLEQYIKFLSFACGLYKHTQLEWVNSTKTKQSLYLSFKEHSVLKFLVIDHGEYSNSVLSCDVGHEVFDCILLVFSINGVNLLCVTL